MRRRFIAMSCVVVVAINSVVALDKTTKSAEKMGIPSPGESAPENIVEPLPSEQQEHLLGRGKWYGYLSGRLNYFNLGKDFTRAISQIEGLFSGQNISMPLMTMNTSFSMQTSQKISRAPTYFIPTGTTGIGFIEGRHSFELEFSIAGAVPLNTIQTDTPMVLSEHRVCNNSELDSCPLAKLGFVNQSSGQGAYQVSVNLNENIWIISPAFGYNYDFSVRQNGKFSIGAACGAMLISARQQLTFSARRIDVVPSASAELQSYQSRVIDGIAQSTAVSSVGPLFRLFVGFNLPRWNEIQSFFRAGISYGFVYLNRSVDGSGTVNLGDTLQASFPTTNLGFNPVDPTKFEMLGGFLQFGILY